MEPLFHFSHPDRAAAAAFFGEVFGLAGFDEGIVTSEGRFIGTASTTEPGDQPHIAPVFSFPDVTTVQAKHDAAVAAGATSHGGVVTEPDGSAHAHLQDPQGAHFALACPPPAPAP